MNAQILLRSADRELLKRCRDAVATAMGDTAETLADPDRRAALEELLADIVEELGAKVVDAPEPEKPRTVRLMDGRVIEVK